MQKTIYQAGYASNNSWSTVGRGSSFLAARESLKIQLDRKAFKMVIEQVVKSNNSDVWTKEYFTQTYEEFRQYLQKDSYVESSYEARPHE
jgi:hypothetical protein